MEVALPVLAMVVIFLLWGLIDQNKAGDTYNQTKTVSDQSQDIDSGNYNLMSLQNYLAWCTRKGYQFYITKSDGSLGPQVEDLKAFMLAILAGKGFPDSVIDSTSFGSESDLTSHVESENYASNTHVCGAVVLSQYSSGGYSYAIRMNASTSFNDDYPQQVPSTFYKVNELNFDGSDEVQRYFNWGFMAVQNVVDTWIWNSTIPSVNFVPFAQRFTPFPVPEWTEDTFVDVIAAVLGLFLTLAFIWPLQRIVKSLVEEKETRIRELMYQMSLSPTAWYFAWLTLYIVFFIVSSILIVLVTASNVYKNSNPAIIWAFYFLFSMTIFAFGYMVSAFFTKANTAATVSTILLLGSFFGYYGINVTTPSNIRTLACISAPVCLGQGAVVIQTLESNGIGVNNDNVGTEVTPNGISVSTVLAMFVVDFFLYSLIGFYFERVWPSDFGVSLEPWFFLNPFYWCPGLRKKDLGDLENREFPEVYEPDPRKPLPKSLKLGLQVVNLRKEFKGENGSFVAVDDLCVDMFRDQVFSLLGHNGAGKTTTINMLTGMYDTTSGDAVLKTRSGDVFTISGDLQSVQKVLGVCPQHDVLFPDLTVREHLRIMARSKGVKGGEIAKTIAETLALVGLTEKIDVQTQALSGGQKRKLSISMALIGNSDLCFLDEPTSGVDPFSRRSMWNVIRKAKKGRVVVLTTHFMDEADFLGDRIGIMEHGKLACCGSSLHLKNAYGVGYTFTVSLKPGGDAKRVRELVKKFVEDAKTRTTAGEVQCRLPLASSQHFPDMMEAFDRAKDEIRFESYGISVTTLEEVFLKVGAATKEILDQDEINGVTTTKDPTVLKPEENDGESDDVKQSLAKAESKVVEVKAKKRTITAEEIETLNRVDMGESGMMRQLGCLLMKRVHNYKRDSRGWAWTILYPLIVITAGIGLITLGIEPDFPSLELDGNMFNQPNYLSVDAEAYRYLVPETRGVQLLNASSSGCKDGLTGVQYPITFDEITTPNAMKNLQQVLACTWADQFEQSKYLGAVAYDTNQTSGGQEFGLVDNFLENKAPGQTQGIYYNDPGIKNNTDFRIPMIGLYNQTGFHSAPVAMNVVNNAIFRNYSGNSGITISVTNNPLPKTDAEKQLSPTIVGLLISLGFAMIPAFFVYFVVSERAIGAKHQQIISGVDITAYWLSTWMWDATSALIPGLLSMAVFAGYGLDDLTGSNSGAMILNIILYLFSVSSFTYCCSFFFVKPNTAQNVMLLVYFMFGAMLAVASDIMDLIDSTQDINKKLKFVWRLSPPFCFAECTINMLRRNFNGRNDELWDMDVTGWPMIFMAWEAVAFFVLVLVIEHIMLNPQLFTWCIPQLVDADEYDEKDDEDEDVKAEKARILDAVRNGEKLDMVTLVGLRKIFGQVGKIKVAVRDMYFTVPQGQCFGFLGINGAGKTTTLKMLTGAVYPTRGEAYMNGLNAITEQRKIRKYLGYCPQFDAFLGTLSARETLTMFGQIKGIAPEVLPDYVTGMISLLGLEEYADRASGGYSGGNKRKLSVGIALMGNPPMVLLDEPSTGMDPASRRTMWNLIQSTMKKRAVILTTHSMEECEALCQRIGIMVGGAMRCLGSEQQLRHRYGNGYQIDTRLKDLEDAKLNDQATRNLIDWVQRTFSGTEVVEYQALNVKFRLPKDLGTNLAGAFRKINSAKEELKITEYSLSEMSLEQIFIYFARQQREEDGDVGRDSVAMLNARTSRAATSSRHPNGTSDRKIAPPSDDAKKAPPAAVEMTHRPSSTDAYAKIDNGAAKEADSVNGGKV
eukprot:CAMPEP_0197517740 /NCGR_PEP_ID=MMETSP1318-20131121/2799_1 /TAXON_ID=552666 /ORGANISM="Partenskyella glossopodia, Strain RCC365" /LENGTH=1779 /DNA_ID=CAMNT_0043067553 /DNA_START=348 /DNA_END=5687 /DNA_ORIENTATION=-